MKILHKPKQRHQYHMLILLNKTLQSSFFPVTLKYISLVIFILLLLAGFSATPTDEAFLMQLRNTNAGNLIVWSYWWPAIVLLAIFFGRIWCMVCPVEVVTSLAARVGLKRNRPAWLLSGWVITLFYLVILFAGIGGSAIHRNPTHMGVYLLVIAGVSVITGLIWEKNTFCRYVCPVGYLLGIYARLSVIGWRVKNKTTCDTCRDKSCIHKKFRYNLNAKSCGVDLYPARITGNADCILCAGCLKTCERYRSETAPDRPNPGFVVTIFARDLFQLKPLRLPEMAFILILSGFVISEIWTEWDVIGQLLRYTPSTLAGWIPGSGSFLEGMFFAAMLFLALPLILWLIPFLAVKATGGSIRLNRYLLSYGIAFIPVIAAAHLTKAILKTTSRIPYFSYLPDDYTGMATAQNILAGVIILPGQPSWVDLTVSVILVPVMLAGIWLSFRVVRKLNAATPSSGATIGCYLIPGLYGAIILGMILAWRWGNYI